MSDPPMRHLETDRLRLRPLTLDDVPALTEGLFSDPKVTWDGRVYGEADARALVEAKGRHLELHGFGMLGVEDKATGELIGYAGLQHLEGGDEIELGYYLRRSAWGRGFGTELARASIEAAFRDLGCDALVAVVRPQNAASKHVLGKAGFQFDGLGHHYGEDVEVWRLRRSGRGAG